MRDGFVYYEFDTGEAYGLMEEVMKAMKRVRDVDGVLTKVAVDAVPVIFRDEVSRVYLASTRKDYDDYRQEDGGRGETDRAEVSSGIGFDALFKKELLWTEAGDAGVLQKMCYLRSVSWFQP